MGDWCGLRAATDESEDPGCVRGSATWREEKDGS